MCTLWCECSVWWWVISKSWFFLYHFPFQRQRQQQNEKKIYIWIEQELREKRREKNFCEASKWVDNAAFLPHIRNFRSCFPLSTFVMPVQRMKCYKIVPWILIVFLSCITFFRRANSCVQHFRHDYAVQFGACVRVWIVAHHSRMHTNTKDQNAWLLRMVRLEHQQQNWFCAKVWDFVIDFWL